MTFPAQLERERKLYLCEDLNSMKDYIDECSTIFAEAETSQNFPAEYESIVTNIGRFEVQCSDSHEFSTISKSFVRGRILPYDRIISTALYA
jgi:hypothetical protein